MSELKSTAEETEKLKRENIFMEIYYGCEEE
jgi:hypothetical protein